MGRRWVRLASVPLSGTGRFAGRLDARRLAPGDYVIRARWPGSADFPPEIARPYHRFSVRRARLPRR